MSQFSAFAGTRVLVTGHTGFKGSWLSLWLSKLGAEVHGVSIDVPTEPSHFLAAGLESQVIDHRIDIMDAKGLECLIRNIQPDYVFHLAAQSLVRRSYAAPVDTWCTNTIGTINVLQALRLLDNPCVAVLITSDKCYDNVEWVWGYRETDVLGGPDPYSASKAAAELAIRSYVRSFFNTEQSVRVGIGRAGNVIGGGDWAEDRIVPDCMRASSRGTVLQLRNPHATRPWQHVLEPLSGYLTLAVALQKSRTLHGEPFNFGPPAGHDYPVCELVESMATHWDKVRWEDVSRKSDGPYESRLLKLNCDKALHHLRWRSLWDFNKTVRETTLWYRHYYEQSAKTILELSARQIDAYTQEARAEGIVWAQ